MQMQMNDSNEGPIRDYRLDASYGQDTTIKYGHIMSDYQAALLVKLLGAPLIAMAFLAIAGFMIGGAILFVSLISGGHFMGYVALLFKEGFLGFEILLALGLTAALPLMLIGLAIKKGGLPRDRRLQ